LNSEQECINALNKLNSVHIVDSNDQGGSHAAVDNFKIVGIEKLITEG